MLNLVWIPPFSSNLLNDDLMDYSRSQAVSSDQRHANNRALDERLWTVLVTKK